MNLEMVKEFFEGMGRGIEKTDKRYWVKGVGVLILYDLLTGVRSGKSSLTQTLRGMALLSYSPLLFWFVWSIHLV